MWCVLVEWWDVVCTSGMVRDTRIISNIDSIFVL